VVSTTRSKEVELGIASAGCTVNKRVVNHIELEERLPVSPTGGRAGEKVIPKFDLGRLLEYVDTLGLNSQRIDFTHFPFQNSYLYI